MSTEHDREVLNTVFNPLLPLGQFVYEENIAEEIIEETAEDAAVSEEVKKLELKGVELAERGKLQDALQWFTQAIELSPNRASGYNNRAQAQRLLGNITEAKIDLNNAINLSGGKGISAAQSYCQRGLIYLKEKQEDLAKIDFENAATLGSQFAKSQLVMMNPYAALCNKMLKKVMTGIQKGESDYYVNSDD